MRDWAGVYPVRTAGTFSIRHTYWLNSILERTMNLKMYSKPFMALKSWSVMPHFSALSTYVFKTLVSFLFKYTNTEMLKAYSQQKCQRWDTERKVMFANSALQVSKLTMQLTHPYCALADNQLQPGLGGGNTDHNVIQHTCNTKSC